MKLGIMLPTVHSIELNLEALRAAEALGVDDVWLNDHLMGWTHPDLWRDFPASQVLPDPDAFLDPFVTAGALAGHTDLRVGFCVTDATRRRGPELARAGLTLQSVCPGGFVLGVGAGEAESILPFGYEWDRPVGNLERALIEIRSLFSTGEMPDGVGRLGLSRQHLPEIWVAAMRPRSLRLTGRYADGWMPIGTNPDDYEQQLTIVRAAAEEAGRPTPQASLLWPMLFGDSRDQVAALLEELPVFKLICLFGSAQMWARHGLEHPAGPHCRGQMDVVPHALDSAQLRAIAPRIPLELLEDFVMIGNAEEVAARIRPFIEAGAEHLLLADVTATTYEPAEAVRHLDQLAKLKQRLDQETARVRPASSHQTP
jgi:phthiodiolone/phenolphthiodiolone dimycocerosates ketoreductase